jgi:type IV pilus assembly protein PilC
MYPIIVAIVAVVVVVFMLVKVVPSYMATFESMGTELPGITLAVIGMSDFIVDYWYIIVLAILILVVAFSSFKSTTTGKYILGKIQLKMPIIGTLNTKTACSLLARTLSTLIYSGLPLIEALRITAKTMTNEVYKQALELVAEEVSLGVPLSNAIKRTKLFPPMVDYMIEVGENTGELEEMLAKLADYYDEEVDMATQTAMAALEPIIILVMAGLVGVLIAAVMAPMLQMYNDVGSL